MPNNDFEVSLIDKCQVSLDKAICALGSRKVTEAAIQLSAFNSYWGLFVDQYLKERSDNV